MGLFKKSAAATVTDTVQPGLVTLEDGTIVHITKEVNAIGSTCPGPQLKTLKAMGEAVPGVWCRYESITQIPLKPLSRCPMI